MFRFACLALVAFAVSASAAVTSPQDLLPPAPPWRGASEALIADASHPWVTPAEVAGFTVTPNYDETIAWLERLANASPRIRLVRFGETAQGRPLYAVIAAVPRHRPITSRCVLTANPRCSRRPESTPAKSTARTPA